MKKVPPKSCREVKQPPFVMRSGRLWFTRETERRLYFTLTVIMLAAGLMVKWGWL